MLKILKMARETRKNKKQNKSTTLRQPTRTNLKKRAVNHLGSNEYISADVQTHELFMKMFHSSFKSLHFPHGQRVENDIHHIVTIHRMISRRSQ